MEQENKGTWIEEMCQYIETDDDYSEYAAQLVDEYCEELGKDPAMSIPVDQYEGPVEDGWTHVWSTKASRLIDQEINMWTMLGLQHWPDGDIDIQQHLTQYKEL